MSDQPRRSLKDLYMRGVNALESTQQPGQDKRHYKTSDLPALAAELSDAPRAALLDEHRETLQVLYQETCNSWRALTDIRFRLLGFVPLVSGVVIVQLLKPTDLSSIVQFGIALLGLTTTVALWIYELRNTELYDDLVSRARRIERELGVHTGQFLGRFDSSRRSLMGLPIPVKHDVATKLIYGSATVGWLLALTYIPAAT